MSAALRAALNTHRPLLERFEARYVSVSYLPDVVCLRGNLQDAVLTADLEGAQFDNALLERALTPAFSAT